MCNDSKCGMSFKQAGKLSIHKKKHAGVIFKVSKVKRNPPSDKVVYVTDNYMRDSKQRAKQQNNKTLSINVT